MYPNCSCVWVNAQIRKTDDMSMHMCVVTKKRYLPEKYIDHLRRVTNCHQKQGRTVHHFTSFVQRKELQYGEGLRPKDSVRTLPKILKLQKKSPGSANQSHLFWRIQALKHNKQQIAYKFNPKKTYLDPNSAKKKSASAGLIEA